MQLKNAAAGLVLAATLATGTTACTPRTAGALLGAALITAAIVGTAQVLAYHDAHFHDETCGHARRYHKGYWVYNYNGHWEYHHAGRWYFYR